MDNLTPDSQRTDPASKVSANLCLAWQEALQRPTTVFQRNAGEITSQQKYRTRAMPYLKSFLDGLRDGTASKESVDLAVEGKLVPISSDDSDAANKFLKRICDHDLTPEELIPLRMAFRNFWAAQRKWKAKNRRYKLTENHKLWKLKYSQIKEKYNS